MGTFLLTLGSDLLTATTEMDLGVLSFRLGGQPYKRLSLLRDRKQQRVRIGADYGGIRTRAVLLT